MALVPRSSVLVLSSTRPSLCSPLIAARASAASALGCVASLVRAASLSLAAGSTCRRRLALAARCTRCRSQRPFRVASVLVLSLIRHSHYSPLTAAQASAASGRSAESPRSSARRYSRSPSARHAGGGSCSLHSARVYNTPRTHHITRFALHTHTRPHRTVRSTPRITLRASLHTHTPDRTARCPTVCSTPRTQHVARCPLRAPTVPQHIARTPRKRDAASSPARRRLALVSSSRTDRTARCAALHARTLCAPRLTRDTLSAIRSPPTRTRTTTRRRAVTQRALRPAAASRSLLARAPAAPNHAQTTAHAAHCAPRFARSTLCVTRSPHARTQNHERPDASRRCGPFSPPPVARSLTSRTPTAPHSAQHTARAQHATHTTWRAVRSLTRTHTTTRAPTHRAQHIPVRNTPRTHHIARLAPHTYTHSARQAPQQSARQAPGALRRSSLAARCLHARGCRRREAPTRQRACRLTDLPTRVAALLSAGLRASPHVTSPDHQTRHLAAQVCWTHHGAAAALPHPRTRQPHAHAAGMSAARLPPSHKRPRLVGDPSAGCAFAVGHCGPTHNPASGPGNAGGGVTRLRPHCRKSHAAGSAARCATSTQARCLAAGHSSGRPSHTQPPRTATHEHHDTAHRSAAPRHFAPPAHHTPHTQPQAL